MLERRPTYMGGVDLETDDVGIDGIDALLAERARDFGANVITMKHRIYYGTNLHYERKVPAPEQVDTTPDDQPQLISV